ncbi:MAG: GNAT family N-acetyltransferase [Gammaproteobacteria bacterium]|nr:GNAT family N-acetyltransferase [Gammaproteobacteria bacterium]
MNAHPSLRPARQEDLAAIENLAADIRCIQWGGLPGLMAKLAERWQELYPTSIRVAEAAGVVQGFSGTYQAPPPSLTRVHGIASNLDAARVLIQGACEDAASRGTALETSLFAKEGGQTLRPDVVDRPVYRLLGAAGFGPSSKTTIMRLAAETPAPKTLPRPYRWAHFNESLLPSLLATYYAAWPEDYYEGDDTAEIADSFRRANNDDLRLAVADNDDVAGYVLTSRPPEGGVIEEVAVHPAHRRRGLGEALTLAAIASLGDRTITLVVMDDNPARRLYERLGFAVWEERVDLVLGPRSL